MDKRSVLPTSQKQGAQFEQVHVQKVYDEIASTVNDIQHKAWPNVKHFLKKLPPGSLVADIGCGNGRYLNVNKKVIKVGVDICQPLVNRARLKGYEVAYGDNLQTPFRDQMFDGVVSIGVIHHFSSHERRVRALKELARILRPGGKLMVYVWAYEQKHRKFECQDVLVPWHEGLKEMKRTGSISSRHSSMGGMSSTSSVSEDDSIDQSKGSDRISNSPRSLHRQNSVSLEDLPSLKEQRDFKSSYYSLEFSGDSPVHRRAQVFKRQNSMTTGRYGNGEHKDTVISECRKLEASLRAMSAGSLEEMRKKAVNGELQRGLENDTFQSEVFDFNGLSIEKYQVQMAGGKRGEGMFELYGDEGDNIIDIPDSAEELQKIVNMSNTDQSRTPTSQTTIRRKLSSKVNPFLKQDSLDPYTFNDVKIPKSDKDSLNGLTNVAESIDKDTESFDEVFVNFKPEKTDSDIKPSFFGSVKSKLLSLFESNNEQQRKKKDMVCKSLDVQDDKRYSVLDMMPRSASRPEFTIEQINMATLLNFKVRQFPLSSFPEQQTQENTQILSNISSLQCENKEFSKNNNEPPSSYMKPSESDKNNTKNQNSGYRQCSGDSDHLNLAKAFLKSNVVSEEYVEVIYDGYIKIDLSKLSEKQSALQNPDNVDVSHTDNQQNNEQFNHDRNLMTKCSEIAMNNCLNKKKDDKCREPSDEWIHTIEDRTDDGFEENMESDAFYSHNLTVNDVQAEVRSEVNEDVFASKLCRFYHVFQQGELDELIMKNVPDLSVIQSCYDHANWCIVAEKVSV